MPGVYNPLMEYNLRKLWSCPGMTVAESKIIENTKTMGCLCLYTLITDVLCPHMMKQRNLDKNRVLRAISRDKQ